VTPSVLRCMIKGLVAVATDVLGAGRRLALEQGGVFLIAALEFSCSGILHDLEGHDQSFYDMKHVVAGVEGGGTGGDDNVVDDDVVTRHCAWRGGGGEQVGEAGGDEHVCDSAACLVPELLNLFYR